MCVYGSCECEREMYVSVGGTCMCVGGTCMCVCGSCVCEREMYVCVWFM